jgi:hypothetical protein
MFSWMLGLSYWRLMRTTCRSHAFSRNLLSRDVMPAPRLKEPQAVPCLQGALEVPLLSPTHESNIGLSFTQQEARPPLGPVMFHLSVEDTARLACWTATACSQVQKKELGLCHPSVASTMSGLPGLLRMVGAEIHPMIHFRNALVKDWTAGTVYSWIEHN